MERLVNEITLRNRHLVYATGTGYIVENIDRNGEAHRRSISQRVFAACRAILAGREWTVHEAQEAIEPDAIALELPYSYGHKLHYYAQDVLLILVAVGEATIRKEGRGFRYQVGG